MEVLLLLLVEERWRAALPVRFGMVAAMRLPGIGSHHSAAAKTDEWLTPPFILDALGPFDLDPSAPAVQPWPTATRTFTLADDGLVQDWTNPDGSHPLVWLNPPYSQIEPWMARLADHGHGVALVFARTETAWWFSSVWGRASAVLFLRGRLHFHLPDGAAAAANAGGPSALVAYGPVAAERLAGSGLPGALVDPSRVVGGELPVPAPRRAPVVGRGQATLFDPAA